MKGTRYARKEQLKRECESNYCSCIVTVLQVVVFCQNASSIAAQGEFIDLLWTN